MRAEPPILRSVRQFGLQQSSSVAIVAADRRCQFAFATNRLRWPNAKHAPNPASVHPKLRPKWLVRSNLIVPGPLLEERPRSGGEFPDLGVSARFAVLLHRLDCRL